MFEEVAFAAAAQPFADKLRILIGIA